MHRPTHRRAVCFTLLLSASLLFTGCAKDPSQDAPKAEVGEVKTAAKKAAPEATDTKATPKAAAPAASGAITLTGDIGFVGSKVTGSHIGTFRKWTGKMTPGATLEASRLEFDVQVDSVFTDPDTRGAWNAKLDRHLVSEDFFFAAKFPKATFVSQKIVAGGTDGATHTLTGDLTMRGVTRSVTFPATMALTPKAFSANAEFTIDRTQWGIVYKGKADNLVRNGVVMKIKLEGTR